MLLNVKFFSRVYYAVILLALIVVGGTLGFMIVEGWSLLDSFYQTIITISTVGFGEVHDLSKPGKLFTAFLIITSFGTFAYAISSITAYIVSGDYIIYFKDYKALKEINKLNGHVIVCGFGRVGSQAIDTLKAHGDAFLVIEQKDDVIEAFRQDGSILYMQGDATNDELLVKAGVMNAKALITTLPSDSENLFVVLSAKELNKNLQVISRASKKASVKKLKIAGASNVIMPDSLGGSHMAQLVSTPDVVEFLDQISIQGENEVNLEEIDFQDIPEDCRYKSLADLKKQFPVCNIIGYKSSDGNYEINPNDETAIVPGSKLFVLGNPEQIQSLNQIFGIMQK